jgi:hypothetical protein
MNKQDYRDWAVLVLVSLGWLVGTAVLVTHYSTVAFGIWGSFSAVIVGAYHFLCVDDDKRVDAGNVQMVLPTEGLSAEFRDWKGDDHEHA